MKVKTIDCDVFEAIQHNSFKSVGDELKQSSERLSEIFGIDFKFKSANESYVLYASENNDAYLKANYSFTENDTIKLENFESMIIDQESKNESRRTILKNIIDAVNEDDIAKADASWNELREKFPLIELAKYKAGKGDVGGGFPGGPGDGDEEGQEKHGKSRSLNKKKAVKGDEEMPAKPGMVPKGELATLNAVDSSLEEGLINFKEVKKDLIESAINVSSIFFKEMKNAKVKTKSGDSAEELDSIEIPTIKKAKDNECEKNDSKKTVTKIAEARNKFARLVDNEEFMEKIIDIKRYSNAQEKKELAEALTGMVVENPSIIYVSSKELGNMIEKIYEDSGEENWDEELCEDIAFGLRKLAYNTYFDKVYEVIKAAATDDVVGLDEDVSDDEYEAFEEISSRYFENIYEDISKKRTALASLSTMLARTAITLESDLNVVGKNEQGRRIVAELRQFAAQIYESAHKNINESIVKMVVGSLLSGMAKDYSLNNASKLVDFGHFRKPVDMDGGDKEYSKWTDTTTPGDATSGSKMGDERMKGPNSGNPMTPKGKSYKDLDLDSVPDIEDFDVMKHGIHSNPMDAAAPSKRVNQDKLDLS